MFEGFKKRQDEFLMVEVYQNISKYPITYDAKAKYVNKKTNKERYLKDCVSSESYTDLAECLTDLGFIRLPKAEESEDNLIETWI